MSKRDWQYCKQCGEELVERREAGLVWDEVKVILICPNKKYDDYNWRAMFRTDKHTKITVEWTDTVLNFDPITGERIKRDSIK